MNKCIITIGREFGSRGHEVGSMLAKRLEIPCYDKELLSRAAQDSGYCQEIFESHDEKPSSSLLYNLVFDTYNSSGVSTGNFVDMPLHHKVFLAQFDSLKNLADEGPCVIIGRCADYALAERDDVVNVFITASEDFKIKTIIENEPGLDEKKARDMMIKQEKRRSSYYNYYTSKTWGACKSYDLTLCCSDIGVEGCVDMIIEFIDRKFKNV